MKAPKQLTRTKEDRKVYKLERKAAARRRAALDRAVMQEAHDFMQPKHKVV